MNIKAMVERLTAENSELDSKYKQKKENILKLLKQLETKIAQHEKQFTDKGKSDWGYVGDLGHIEEEIKNLHEFLK